MSPTQKTENSTEASKSRKILYRKVKNGVPFTEWREVKTYTDRQSPSSTIQHPTEEEFDRMVEYQQTVEWAKLGV